MWCIFFLIIVLLLIDFKYLIKKLVIGVFGTKWVRPHILRVSLD